MGLFDRWTKRLPPPAPAGIPVRGMEHYIARHGRAARVARTKNRAVHEALLRTSPWGDYTIPAHVMARLGYRWVPMREAGGVASIQVYGKCME